MRDGKVFIYTNILVYAYDVSAGAKHEEAVAVMSDLWNTGRGVTSMQVLQEFFVNATGKIPKPLDVTTAREVVRDFLKWNPILINGEIIVDAIDIHAAHKYSFWDALIIASAIESGAGTLLTEDLSDKYKIKNIVIRNPFKQLR
jgi:predicted nucleic acid-binding protein